MYQGGKKSVGWKTACIGWKSEKSRVEKIKEFGGSFMNARYLYNGWNLSKNNNLYKIIDGECYTIIRRGNDYTVIADGYKIKNLSSMMAAKEEIYNIAYEETEEREPDSKFFDNPMFKEILKMGYRQLSKKYHPDITGGSAEKMKSLNKLYDEIKEVIA